MGFSRRRDRIAILFDLFQVLLNDCVRFTVADKVLYVLLQRDSVGVHGVLLILVVVEKAKGTRVEEACLGDDLRGKVGALVH